MYRFFVEPSQVGEKEIIITGSDVNHILEVTYQGEWVSVTARKN